MWSYLWADLQFYGYTIDAQVGAGAIALVGLY